MKRRWAWLLGFVLLTAFAVLAFRTIAWDEALATLRQADPIWVAAAVASNFLVLPVSTFLWLVCLPSAQRVGFRTMFWVMAITFTVANGGPFLAGHAVGVYLLATRGGTGHQAAISVKAVEQLALGVAKLTLVLAAALTAPLPGRLRSGAVILLAVVAVLGIVLVTAAHRSESLERWADGTGGRLGAVRRFTAGVASRLEAARRPRVLAAACGLAFGRLTVEGLAVVAVVMSLGIEIPTWGIILVLAAVNLSTMASITPANLGVYEASAILAYRAAGVSPELALGAAVLQHVAYLVPVAGTGWVVLAASGLRVADVRRRARRSEVES